MPIVRQRGHRHRKSPVKYFFHMEGGACIHDPQGVEFSDDDAALREAVNVARGIMEQGMRPGHWRVVVRNADGRRIGSVGLTSRHDQPNVEIDAKN